MADGISEIMAEEVEDSVVGEMAWITAEENHGECGGGDCIEQRQSRLW